jgi:Trk K+ transport system NAD-binding subunit
MSGERMAALLTRPGVVEFVDTTLRRDGLAYNLEEIVVLPDSPLIDHTLDHLHRETGHEITVLAVFGADQLIPHPPLDYCVEAGDTLIVIGHEEQIAALSKLGSRRRASV